MSSLEIINQRWHDQLAQAFNHFLAQLTALELEQAQSSWVQFNQSLSTHLAFEDEHISPLCNDLPDNAQTLIHADHTILIRLMSRIDIALDELASSAQARETMVEQLDGYLKLRNVLTHHDLRETQQVYPALIAIIGDEQQESLASQMHTAFESSSAPS